MFGEPPVRVFARAGVLVEVYFWLQPSTSVNDHTFSGAFGVLAGATWEANYRSDTDAAPDAPFAVGTLIPTNRAPVAPGAVRPIFGTGCCVAGQAPPPHRVVHLCRPMAPVCLRTTRDDAPGRLHRYEPPKLRIDTNAYLGAAGNRMVALAQMAASVQFDDLFAFARTVAGNSDDRAAFWCLWTLFGRGPDPLLAMQLAVEFPGRPLFDHLIPALFARLRSVERWSAAVEPAQRLDAALQEDGIEGVDEAAAHAQLKALLTSSGRDQNMRPGPWTIPLRAPRGGLPPLQPLLQPAHPRAWAELTQTLRWGHDRHRVPGSPQSVPPEEPHHATTAQFPPRRAVRDRHPNHRQRAARRPDQGGH